MAKLKDLTEKELKAELKKAEKALEVVRADNKRMRVLLVEVEPALATANEQVQELRSAVDYLTTELNCVRDELKRSIEGESEANDGAKTEFDRKVAFSEDLSYERLRRISAENKLYDLEQRLFVISTENYKTPEIRSNMVGLRIDRNGKIA